MFPENVPDLTVDELLEHDEDDEFSMDEDDIAEMEEHYEEMQMTAHYTYMAVTLGRLLMDGQITFAEYLEHIEWLEDLADEQDITLP